jgi:hypothetical protein
MYLKKGDNLKYLGVNIKMKIAMHVKLSDNYYSTNYYY